MMRTAIELLIAMPVVWDLGLRITALLIATWLLHFILVRFNARWRVRLWRFTPLAIVALAFTALFPRIPISIVGPPTTRPSAASYSQLESSENDPQQDRDSSVIPSLGDSAVPTNFSIENSELPSIASSAVNAGGSRESPVSSRLEKPWQWMLFACWCLGTALLAIRWVVAQRRVLVLLSKTTAASESCDRLLRQVADELQLVGPVVLRVSHESSVPFVTGWRRPTIVLPACMARTENECELTAIFSHELSHVLSNDIAWMGMTQWVAISLWFHPLAWRIQAAHAMSCEEVADAIAAGKVGNVASYSGTLARVALAAYAQPSAAMVISMARSPEILSRLTQLKRGLSGSPLTNRRVALAAALGLLSLIPLATLKFAYAGTQETAGDEKPGNETSGLVGQRILEFPTDRSVGVLSIATAYEDEWVKLNYKKFDYQRDWNWKHLGQAQGQVVIPAGAKVQLTLKSDGANDMSWTGKLKPDDLYELIVYPHPANANAYLFKDTHLQSLCRLTGLSNLELMYVHVTDQGVRHMESLASLKKLVIYSPELGNSALESIGKLTTLQVLGLSKMKWDDAGLLHLANLKSLEEINLPMTSSPGPGFNGVVQLPRLKYLSGGTFTDAHLAHLQGAKALRALNLDSNEFITDAGLARLVDVPQLEALDLYHTNITDAGVRHLKNLKSLKRINLIVNRKQNKQSLTLATAAVLSELKSLEHLNLPSVADGDKFIEQISHLGNLQSLQISGQKESGFITDEGTQYLANLKKLTRLTLAGVKITDKTGDSLASLSNLTYLFLDSNDMSDDGVAKFSALKKLRYLNLSSHSRKTQRLTASALSRLNGLPELNELWFGTRRPAPGDKGMDFSGFPQLEKISISFLRDEDLAELAHCKNLKSLGTSLAHITDAGLAHLSGLRSMEQLYLDTDGITDAGLVHLVGMNRLHELTVRGKLTDDGLQHIEKLKSLGVLSLNTTATFSSDAITNLRESLPNLYRFSVNQDRVTAESKKESLKVGQAAPEFRIKSLDGKEISIAGHKGKVLLLYFWSTSCVPCIASIPQMKQSHAELSKYDDFAMVSLSGDENDSIVQELVTKHKIPWPQVRIGEDSKIAAEYQVTGYPSYILIGRDGKVLCTRASELDAALRGALDIKEDKSN